MKKVLALSLMLMSTAACSLAPDFSLPRTETPAAFKEDLTLQEGGSWKVGAPAAAQERGQWWRIFNDPALDALIAEATANNQDAAAMAARVKQARALAGIARSYQFPTITGDAGVSRRQLGSTGPGVPGGGFAPDTVYSAGLGLSYELDLFGRVLNGKRAAKADAQSAQENYNSMLLALQADVAQLYFTLRGLDAEIKLVEDTLRLREDSLVILNKRLEVGSITELDVAQSIVDLETTRTELQSAQQRRKESEHALAVLLGKPPAAFTLEKGFLNAAAPVVPAGIPSSVLERRPDITAAQYDLMAANARIGVARASFFPNISLTASGGFESNSLGNLFDWGSRTWALGPLAAIPVFNGGRAFSNNENAKAQYEEAVALYRQQVLVAFKDVEDSLSRLKMLSDQAASQVVAKEAADRAARIAGLRYESGDTGYLEDITAKRNALDVSRFGIQIQAARMAETVALIRALGGGW